MVCFRKRAAVAYRLSNDSVVCMNDELERVRRYFQGAESEDALPFVYPVDAPALMYFEPAGDEVIVRCKEKAHPAEVVRFTEKKTGSANWIIKYGYPIQANGVWEWRLV